MAYKYNEDKLLDEIRRYIDRTYGEHYGKSNVQTTEFIIDQGHGIGFTLGNVIKYCQRYGKKEGYNRKDLLKVVHYAIIALHAHDLVHSKRVDDWGDWDDSKYDEMIDNKLMDNY